MLPTGYTATSHSNFQLVIDALFDYANITGSDPSQNPFAEKIRQSNTADDILELLLEREKDFKEYRDGNRRLINYLKPAVHVLHAFSLTLGEVVSQVRNTCPIYLLHFLYISVLILYARSPSHRQKPSLLVLMFSSPYVSPPQLQPKSL
jgi:hypothetical protein